MRRRSGASAFRSTAPRARSTLRSVTTTSDDGVSAAMASVTSSGASAATVTQGSGEPQGSADIAIEVGKISVAVSQTVG